MTFTCNDLLLDYIQRTGKQNIIVEYVSVDHSDFDVTELHVFAADEKRAKYFLQQKKYKLREASFGNVLLPPQILEYDETVHFTMKKYWFIRSIKVTGIKL